MSTARTAGTEKIRGVHRKPYNFLVHFAIIVFLFSPYVCQSASEVAVRAPTIRPAEPPPPGYEGVLRNRFLNLKRLKYRVVQKYPHPRTHFTQGLVYRDGVIYEGLGLEGQSGVVKYKLDTTEILGKRPLADHYFGEGIALIRSQVYELTWLHQTGVVLDSVDLRPISTFRYSGEGWGLTTDGKRLIVSHGDNRLSFFDIPSPSRPNDLLNPKKTLWVFGAGNSVKYLNALQWIERSPPYNIEPRIWANVWQTDLIVQINPKNGAVVSYLDAAELYPPGTREPGSDVLNGIAWDPSTSQLLVTGKRWPHIYRLEIMKDEAKSKKPGPIKKAP